MSRLFRITPNDVKARLGEYNFTRVNETRTQDFQIVDIRVHLDFSSHTYEHDIAVLKLHRRATFNSYVWPVCLPPPGPDFENATAVVTGACWHTAVPWPSFTHPPAVMFTAACRVGHPVLRRSTQPSAHAGGSARVEPQSLQVSLRAANHGHGPVRRRVRRGQGRLQGTHRKGSGHCSERKTRIVQEAGMRTWELTNEYLCFIGVILTFSLPNYRTTDRWQISDSAGTLQGVLLE
jgi:hypothetical protein